MTSFYEEWLELPVGTVFRADGKVYEKTDECYDGQEIVCLDDGSLHRPYDLLDPGSGLSGQIEIVNV